MKKIFSEESLNATFASLNYDYEDMKQLMVDTALGTQSVSKKEAEEAIRNMMFSVLELAPANLDNQKLFKRAMKNNKNRLFEVIEDVVDEMLIHGWSNDPFFMNYVDQKNLADGDRNEFWTEEEITLAVANVSGDHHDIF